ncbi:hypothetical protein Tco_1032595 [Tanacetum coccineum]|uniref:Reverse transcriptase domain-containing protein n=1 Tax=Tanacetum coccineum TaxID=301880 RepID=A0ABQ5GDX7_9ASTR
MPPHRTTGEDENPPDIATLLAQQLQNLLPEIVNQVTAHVNANANKWLIGNVEYDGKGGAVVLTHWIERMETMIDNSGCAKNQKAITGGKSFCPKGIMAGLGPPEIRGFAHWANSNQLLSKCNMKAGIIIDEAVSNETLTKGLEEKECG